MKLVLRLAARELRNNWRFALFFAINLAAGLVGLITVESLRFALQESLNVRSRQILGADLSISGRRPLTSDEREKVESLIGDGARSTRILDSMSMVAGRGTSRLAQIRAVESAYPFYGELKLRDGGTLSAGAGKQLQVRPVVWVDESLARELGLEVGQKLSLGGQLFEIADLLVEDSTNGFSSFNIAQRVYVARILIRWLGVGERGLAVAQQDGGPAKGKAEGGAIEIMPRASSERRRILVVLEGP